MTSNSYLISDNFFLTIMLSPQFKSVQVELRTNKNGKVKRLFLSPTVVKEMFRNGNQVTKLMLKLKKDVMNNTTTASSVIEIPLDDKKRLSISGNSLVEIQTFKEGKIQMGLSK